VVRARTAVCSIYRYGPGREIKTAAQNNQEWYHTSIAHHTSIIPLLV
jgi:hypothetical protein